jgi:S1-C subfamily serine protease
LLTAEAGEIKVQLFGKMPALPRQELRLGGLTPAKELEGGIPAKVVAKGNPYPGRDVAVLRTTRTPANLGVSDPYLLDKDRLICLRLGNSADVEPGMRVQAFGFPGLAFDPAMPDEAKRLVSCQNGQIGQIKPLRGEMPVIFEMTADTNHGDSGGPVLDKHGFVIGLNVAGYLINKDDAEHMLAGHNLAVPIDVAKPFLKAAGIDHLDPGPLTEHWERGLRLYAAEDYAGAEQEFAELLQLQESGGWPSGGLPSLPGAGGDPYVKEVYVRCRIKQGKLKLPTPK